MGSNDISPEEKNQQNADGIEAEVSNKERQCRDISFLVLFVVFVVGLSGIAWRATLLGNPGRIIYGTDSWGNVCNQQNDVIEGVVKTRTGLNLERKSVVFYFNGNLFLPEGLGREGQGQSVRICVASCPQAEVSTVIQMVALSGAPAASVHLCVYDIPPSGFFAGSSNGLDDCPPLPVHAHTALLHRCIPDAGLDMTSGHVFDVMDSMLNSLQHDLLQKGLSDIRRTWLEIVCLCLLSVAAALIITLMLQFLARIIIWLILVAMVTGCLVTTVICWMNYHTMNAGDATLTHGREEATRAWLLGAIAVTVISVILILVLLFLRKHIKLVVELFREAGKAISKMPVLLVVPLVTVLALIGTLAAATWLFLYMESAGVPVVDKNSGFVHMEEDHYINYLKWLHVFGIVWMLQFILACHRMIVSGAVSQWYFTKYHVGSIALGSLIITVVMVVRMILSFIQNRLRGGRHPVAVFLLKCLQCCLWCFEKFLQFINTDAYIEIGIYGCSFCKGARKAFRIIQEHALQLTTINSVGDFVLFLGKAATVAIVTVSGIEIVSTKDGVYFPWLPVTISAVFAFVVATAFLSVYETTIDTIFICYCEDMSLNNGVDMPFYTSVGLRQCMTQRQLPSNKVAPSNAE